MKNKKTNDRRQIYLDLYEFEKFMNTNNEKKDQLIIIEQAIKYLSNLFDFEKIKRFNHYEETIKTNVQFSSRQLTCFISSLKALNQEDYRSAFHEFVDMIDNYGSTNQITFLEVHYIYTWIETFYRQ